MPTVADAARAESVAEACERVHKLRLADGANEAKNEIARLRAYLVPAIGDIEVTKAKPTDINAAFDFCKAKGKARQIVAHLRQDIRNVSGSAIGQGIGHELCPIEPGAKSKPALFPVGGTGLEPATSGL